jgi:hypothetical protein
VLLQRFVVNVTMPGRDLANHGFDHFAFPNFVRHGLDPADPAVERDSPMLGLDFRDRRRNEVSCQALHETYGYMAAPQAAQFPQVTAR